MISQNIKGTENYILVIGKTAGHLYQSELYREVIGFKNGPPPEINLFNEKNNGMVIQKLISKKIVKSVHDISSGGILVALTEMCLAGNIGVKIKTPNNNMTLHEYMFAEDQSRYLIEINEENHENVSKILKENSVHFDIIGKTQKEKIELSNNFSISLNDLKMLFSSWFYNYNKV